MALIAIYIIVGNVTQITSLLKDYNINYENILQHSEPSKSHYKNTISRHYPAIWHLNKSARHFGLEKCSWYVTSFTLQKKFLTFKENLTQEKVEKEHNQSFF